jgi:stress response protein YsnF
MKKIVAVFCIVAALAAGTFVLGQAQQNQPKATASDPRLDKLIEQNEQILRNQQEILNQLKDIKEGVLQLRRRSS